MINDKLIFIFLIPKQNIRNISLYKISIMVDIKLKVFNLNEQNNEPIFRGMTLCH